MAGGAQQRPGAAHGAARPVAVRVGRGIHHDVAVRHAAEVLRQGVHADRRQRAHLHLAGSRRQVGAAGPGWRGGRRHHRAGPGAHPRGRAGRAQRVAVRAGARIDHRHGGTYPARARRGRVRPAVRHHPRQPGRAGRQAHRGHRQHCRAPVRAAGHWPALRRSRAHAGVPGPATAGAAQGAGPGGRALQLLSQSAGHRQPRRGRPAAAAADRGEQDQPGPLADAAGRDPHALHRRQPRGGGADGTDRNAERAAGHAAPQRLRAARYRADRPAAGAGRARGYRALYQPAQQRAATAHRQGWPGRQRARGGLCRTRGRSDPPATRHAGADQRRHRPGAGGLAGLPAQGPVWRRGASGRARADAGRAGLRGGAA